MEPTKKNEYSEMKPQPVTQSEQINTGEGLGGAASIADICTAITKLVNAVSEVGSRKIEPQTELSHLTEDRSDTLWENVCDFAAQLALAHSSSLDDISGKINIWRHLAPEQGLENKFPTIDETLLLSILSDVERMRSRQAH